MARKHEELVESMEKDVDLIERHARGIYGVLNGIVIGVWLFGIILTVITVVIAFGVHEHEPTTVTGIVDHVHDTTVVLDGRVYKNVNRDHANIIDECDNVTLSNQCHVGSWCVTRVNEYARGAC
jgi:hypothetical protein